MKSSIPKVLHEVAGRPLVYHVLQQLVGLEKHIDQILVVVGYQAKLVEKEIKKHFPGVQCIYQKKLLGTADALRCAKDKVSHDKVLILCGDAPLIRRSTLASLISSKKKSSCCVVSACKDGKNSLGRIIRDSKGRVKAIREAIELGAGANHREVNSGIYLFDRKILFSNLKKIEKNKKKGEYFLTDIIEILYGQGIPVDSYMLESDEEILGINTQKDLHLAEKIMRSRLLEQYIDKGVRIIDPETTFIEEGVKIGKNTVIFPFTFIEKGVIIGANCSLGPFIHVRGNSRINNDTHLGNYVEVNRSVIGKNVKMKHFGYLGDTAVEGDANIGAGTVVANFDGKRKHKTHIGKEAFIGSDTILVAPVKVGKKGATGAGSVVTKDVKAGTVVVGVPAKILKKRKG
ncbi:MAG: bifunctional N-acetylglucosamine-1-phosphate uridyltransferase/glucosamine-1-phosphate acetyltransferase [Candidatus Omnitrophota bacterium]|nr:MAG: bifunctional N-acetylglucosamine-1-phosphate uridyltransferase/glucosamine-1-phosphate acetyltransferase [Candidatus Omnitrophota bacterium]